MKQNVRVRMCVHISVLAPTRVWLSTHGKGWTKFIELLHIFTWHCAHEPLLLGRGFACKRTFKRMKIHTLRAPVAAAAGFKHECFMQENNVF